MLKPLLVSITALVAATAMLAAQPASPTKLTGTVVAVNQQSDSITLIDLKTMEEGFDSDGVQIAAE